MILRPLTVAGLALLAVAGLAACQSTQDRSAELASKGSKTLLNDKGLTVDKESTDVKVTSTALLTDPNGSAVVVDLHNDSGQNLTDVPILIDVLDAKGKSVYKNNVPGIEQALAAVPYIPANGDVEWVNDQVLVAGKPKSVKVRVGASTASFSGALPDIQVSPPTVAGDPVSGIEAAGTVVNKTGADQGRLLLYGVARKGNRVVAAGRGAIEHLKAGAKKLKYYIYFIGNPQGADVKVTQFPTLPGSQ